MLFVLIGRGVVLPPEEGHIKVDTGNAKNLTLLVNWIHIQKKVHGTLTTFSSSQVLKKANKHANKTQQQQKQQQNTAETIGD